MLGGGGGGVNCRSTFKKNIDYGALHFQTGLLKINISKVLFWQGGRGSQKKEYSTYAFVNVNNPGPPLTGYVMMSGWEQTEKLTAAGNPGIRYLSVPSPDHSHSSSPSRQLENTQQ